jgi:hypothetical protein
MYIPLLIIKAFFWIVGSVVLIHIAGFLGFFVALAYSMVWLILPKKTPCLFCRTRKIGEMCPACKIKIEDKHFAYPRNLRSVVLNSVTIFVVSLISLSMLFLEARALSYFGVSPLDKSVSFVIPTKGSYRLGELFPLGVDLTGVETNINTVRADLSYDPQFLEVSDIVTDNSFATIFVQKEINNQVGFARISGGVPNPGVNCTGVVNDCHFANFIFKTIKPGTVTVKYLPTSMVLANDGAGSNILKDFGAASFLILPEKISKEEQTLETGNLNLTVLGTETGDTGEQLHLYQGNPALETGVLGTNTVTALPANSRPPNFWQKALTLIEKYDLFVVGVWRKVFGY